MSVPSLPCTSINVGPDGLCITMPGGAAICLSYPTSGIPSGIAATKALLAQANTALAPLMPFFRIIECLDAAKDLLYDPDKFFTALANVLGMVPTLTVPILIANVLDLLIAYLQGLYVQLQAFVAQLQAIVAGEAKATTLGCPALQLQCDCARGQIDLQMASFNNGVDPLNALIDTINIILGLVPGAPSVDPIGHLGSDPAAALAPLAATIATLQAVRANPFFPV